MLGRPILVGFSVRVTEVQPMSAIRLISFTVSSMSQVGSSAQGMKRAGSVPHQSRMCQSL